MISYHLDSNEEKKNFMKPNLFFFFSFTFYLYDMHLFLTNAEYSKFKCGQIRLRSLFCSIQMRIGQTG